MTPNNAIDRFKLRRDLWIECLCGTDRHSIMPQIYRMIWNTAAFRAINEARRIAPPAKEGSVQLSGLMHELIDEGFFEGQALAIRRLTDTHSLDDRRRGVWSLIALLNDMQEHVDLMTRQNLFAAEGLEYDVEAVRRRAEEYQQQELRKGTHVYFIPEELDWDRLRDRHEQIDFLARVTPAHRSPDDTVCVAVIERLKNMVNTTCAEVHVHVNKFVAHAASPESRQTVNADRNANHVEPHLHGASGHLQGGSLPQLVPA